MRTLKSRNTCQSSASGLGTGIQVTEKITFDGSMCVQIGHKKEFISSKLANHVFVEIL